MTPVDPPEISRSNACAPKDPSGSPNDPLDSLWDRWQGGDPGARDQLIHRLLPRLRERIAAQLTEDVPEQTAAMTAMVAEVVGGWFETSASGTESRAQLTCLATECIRRMLVETARKDGVGPSPAREHVHSALESALGFVPEKSAELIQVDEALDDLATFNPDGALAVTLRYFGGLSHPQMASALDLSESKALMVWVEARAWLYMQFQPDFLPED